MFVLFTDADDEAQLRLELDEIGRLSDAALLEELGGSSVTQDIVSAFKCNPGFFLSTYTFFLSSHIINLEFYPSSTPSLSHAPIVCS